MWSLSRKKTAPILALAALACGGPRPELAKVGEPTDFAMLDAAVREQFVEVRGRFDEVDTAVEEGAAWGALGQWFQVYHYADSAALCYGNARLLDPREPRWPYYLGRLAEEAGDLEAAVREYRSAAELDPQAAAPRVRLGDLSLKRQDFDGAEKIFRDVLAAHPGQPGALFGTAELALARGDAAAALAPLETLAALQPEAFEVRYSLSLAYRQLGEPERAAEQLRLIPENNGDQMPLDPQDPWWIELYRLDRGARNLSRRAVRAAHRGEDVKAAVLFGRAVAANPDGPENYVNYGVALGEMGRWQEAEEQLAEALRLAEEGSKMAAKAHLELGRSLAFRGRPDEAAPHLEAALAIDPQLLPARLVLGRLLYRQGRLEEALGHYAAAREIDRGQPDVRFWHAAVLTALGRRKEAKAALEEDLREIGDDRSLRLLLVRLFAASPEDELRDPDGARVLLEASDEPPDAFFAETAAMAAAGQGRFREAVAWQQAAVAALAGVRPRNAAHTARRRLVLYERGEPCRHPWEEQEALVRVPVSRP